MTKHCLKLASLFTILINHDVMSQEFDVDAADSLDFESFHSQNSLESKTDKKPKHTATLKLPENNQGKTFTIKERYGFTRSKETPYSVNQVIEPLHQKMAARCPKGWNKLQEWSVPVGKGFNLHYKFKCR